ncbi:MAG: hypothetical protein HQL52_12930 [Magnetococcales bacterium]|nr:hypothetical protein [Magnetococcales bacterium]
MGKSQSILILAAVVALASSGVQAESIEMPFSFSAGETIYSSEVNANFDTLVETVNSQAETIDLLTELATHAYSLGEEAVTYDAAVSACSDRGGHLVTISSEEENEKVMNLVQSSNIVHTNGHRYTWIGLDDYEVEGDFAWVTGDEVTYTNWYDGEPNDNGGEEDCALMIGDSGSGPGTWNDGTCSTSELNYICEFD